MYTLPRDSAEVGNVYVPRRVTAPRPVGTACAPGAQPMPPLWMRLRLGQQADPLGLGHDR